MTILIHHKLKPFTHQKGHKVLIPGTAICLKVYPCAIMGIELKTQKTVFELNLQLEEFYKEFTAEVDFDKRMLRVFGKTKNGFVEYKIYKNDDQLIFCLDRFQGTYLNVHLNNIKQTLKTKEAILLAKDSVCEVPQHEKLFLGISKKQDLHRIDQEKNLNEYLPYLFELGSSLSAETSYDIHLKPVVELLKGSEKEKEQQLEKIVLGFFHEGFIPSLKDDFNQGLQNLGNDNMSPLALLKQIYLSLKQSLISLHQDQLDIFMSFPKMFVSGKATGLEFAYGKIHLEWTKGFLRQIILNIQKPCDLNLNFPKTVKSFRVRKGRKIYKDQTHFEAGIYHFDKFQA